MKKKKTPTSSYALYNNTQAVSQPSGKRPKQPLWWVVLMVLFCALFLFGIIMLTSYVIDSCAAKDSTQKARDLYNSVTNSPRETPEPQLTPENTPSVTATPEMLLPGETEASVTVETAKPVSSSPTFRPYYFDTSGRLLEKMDQLLTFNRDTVGWLTMDGMLDEVVVYKDNEYYLTHLFDRSENPAGTLFLDENTPVGKRGQYLLVHGHNMKDGTRFAPFTNFEQSGDRGLNYMKKHAFATFSTLYAEEQYVVYAVCHTSLNYRDSKYVQYWGFNHFNSVREFDNFIQRIRKLSLFNIPIDVDASDALLTLSTCIGEDRLIVCMRRVRPGEWIDTLNTQINRSTRK